MMAVERAELARRRALGELKAGLEELAEEFRAHARAADVASAAADRELDISAEGWHRGKSAALRAAAKRLEQLTGGGS